MNSIAHRIARRQIVECYSQFGAMDFCEKCPIVAYCKKAKEDNRRLKTFENWRTDRITYSDPDPEPEKRKVDLPGMATVAALLTLTPLEYSVVWMRLNKRYMSAKDIADELNITDQTVRSSISVACRKIPALGKALYLTWRGRKGMGANTTPKPVICIETDKTFRSLTQAAKWLGVFHTDISRSIASGRSIKGHTFRFITKEERIKDWWGYEEMEFS